MKISKNAEPEKIRFAGFSPRTIDFMWNLRFNNNREWFLEHKGEYQQEFLRPMKALAAEVFARMEAKYPEYGFMHKVSRIYKDARRVRNGEPYRDHLWFSIERPSEEWTTTPVFWFELGPETWSYGLGYYQAKPITMAKLRARINAAPEKLEKLLAFLPKQGEFTLEGDEYARKKEAPTEKTALMYNKKRFSFVHEQNDGPELFSPDLADRIFAGYTALMPMYAYIVTLDADPDPVNG